MSRFQRRDREAIVNRLARLLYVMEGVANEGWSKQDVARRSPNYEDHNTGGDRIVSDWFDQLTTKVDDLIEKYLLKLDEREERLVGTTFDIQNALRQAPAEPRCPGCGASTRAMGRF